MAFADKIITSLFGRRVGLQPMSSSQTGGRAGEFLVGPDSLRLGVTTAETTATNLAAHGVSFITSAVSSGVYVLDPPIPGVHKTLTFTATGATAYVRTANNETILTASQGTSGTVIKSTQNASGALFLMGMTTAAWALTAPVSTTLFAVTTST